MFACSHESVLYDFIHGHILMAQFPYFWVHWNDRWVPSVCCQQLHILSCSWSFASHLAYPHLHLGNKLLKIWMRHTCKMSGQRSLVKLQIIALILLVLLLELMDVTPNCGVWRLLSFAASNTHVDTLLWLLMTFSGASLLWIYVSLWLEAKLVSIILYDIPVDLNLVAWV